MLRIGQQLNSYLELLNVKIIRKHGNDVLILFTSLCIFK